MMILNRNITHPAVDDEAVQKNTSRVRRRPSHWKKDTPEDSTKNTTTTTTATTRRRRRRRPVNNKTRCDDDTASTVSASLSSSSSDEENSNKQQPPATKSTTNKSTTSTKKKSQANNQRRRRSTTSKKNNKKSSSPKVIQFPTELTPLEKSQYIALDAEMVGVGPYGQHSRLARITIVNYDGECIYDHHVQVLETVTDYRTHVSGITSEDIAPPSTSSSSSSNDNNDNDDSDSNGRNPPIPYEQCQQEVASILHDKIVIGHGLKNDFRVLGLHHPWTHTRDTARYEPFMKKVSDNEEQMQQQQYHHGKEYIPKKLKTLAKDKLGLDIQIDGVPHCPMEDATAALELYKKHRVKWECAMRYKIERTREITATATDVTSSAANTVKCC